MTTSADTRAPDARPLTTVAITTLGCARNDVDSEELAGRLEAGGFRLVDDPSDAETVVVNTCGRARPRSGAATTSWCQVTRSPRRTCPRVRDPRVARGRYDAGSMPARWR